MARKFNDVWQKKARCLGVLTIFKQALDSNCIKVHPDGMGALKKTGLNPSEEHGVDGTPMIGMG